MYNKIKMTILHKILNIKQFKKNVNSNREIVFSLTGVLTVLEIKNEVEQISRLNHWSTPNKHVPQHSLLRKHCL